MRSNTASPASKVLVHETFRGNWKESWKGLRHHATGTSTGLRLWFRQNEHYGTALYREVSPCRHVRCSYTVRVMPGWDSHSTGKTLGFADLRWKNPLGQSYAHGNRRPAPDGFSFRTWFGKTKDGYMPIGMYVYHLGQKPKWGDSIKVGQVQVGADPVLFECEADFDEGFIRARLDGGDWVRHNIVVSDKTAVTRAWVDAYYGGSAVAPKAMSWEVTDYRLENLGVAVEDPGVDWEAIAAMVAEREEADKETAEAEQSVQSIADELRDLADRVEQL